MRPAVTWGMCVLAGVALGGPLAAQMVMLPADSAREIRDVDSIAVDSGLITISTIASTGKVQIVASTPAGTFALRADPAKSAAWADSAAALRGPDPAARGGALSYHGSRFFEEDTLIHANRVMQLVRLSSDSGSAYMLGVSNGSWVGDLSLPPDAAQRLFAALRHPPAPASVIANARDLVRLTRGEPVAVDAPRPEVFLDFQVDRQASPDAMVQPRYPKSLLNARITGTVVMQFVVDTSGRADPSTITVLRSPDPLFALVVRDAIVRSTYHPATVGGHRVKQLVQEPFAFDVR